VVQSSILKIEFTPERIVPDTCNLSWGLLIPIPTLPPTRTSLLILAPPAIVKAPPEVILDTLLVLFILKPPLYNTTDPVLELEDPVVEYKRNSPYDVVVMRELFPVIPDIL
jgi:hypothetical protein